MLQIKTETLYGGINRMCVIVRVHMKVFIESSNIINWKHLTNPLVIGGRVFVDYFPT